MTTIPTLSAVALLLALLLLLVRLRRGNTSALMKRLSALYTAVSAILLMFLLGIRMAVYSGCTAIVFEDGQQHIEDRCKR